MQLWMPLSALATVAFLFAFGTFVSNITKAYVSSLIPAVVIFVILMYTGIVPPDICAIAGLTGMLGTFATPLVSFDVGTKIGLKDLRKEWKTFITVVIASIGILIFLLVFGSIILGRQSALASVPSLTGAMLATVLVQTSANEVGAQDISVFVAIILCIQMLGGLPIASIFMKKYISGVRKSGELSAAVNNLQTENEVPEHTKSHFLPRIPDKWHSEFLILAQMSAILYVAYIVGTFLADVTHNFIGASLCYIFAGILAAEFGLIKKNPLTASKSYGITNLALFSVMLSSFAGVAPEVFFSQIIPAFLALALAIIGIIIFGFLVGKLLKVDPWLSICIGSCCFLGYPPSQVITEEVIRSVDGSDDEKAALTNMILPKMIVGYLTSAIVSLALAGYLVTVIF